MLNVAYAYLAERADAADSAAVPTYEGAEMEPEDIAKRSRRGALDEWLNSPLGDEAGNEQALLAYLTS